MSDKTYWYQCQERAMAPGIADGWPTVIPAPHTPNGRLVRRDGDPTEDIFALRTQLAASRERERVLRVGCQQGFDALAAIADDPHEDRVWEVASNAKIRVRDTLAAAPEQEGGTMRLETIEIRGRIGGLSRRLDFTFNP